MNGPTRPNKTKMSTAADSVFTKESTAKWINDWARGIDKYGLIKNFQLLVKETIEKVEKCQTE